LLIRVSPNVSDVWCSRSLRKRFGNFQKASGFDLPDGSSPLWQSIQLGETPENAHPRLFSALFGIMGYPPIPRMLQKSLVLASAQYRLLIGLSGHNRAFKQMAALAEIQTYVVPKQ
ncbi:MAG: hypothetical protein PF483_04595, partial [Halothiobacillus sp.]|nr:hypothetical protein [Halothiobacillus sp.]